MFNFPLLALSFLVDYTWRWRMRHLVCGSPRDVLSHCALCHLLPVSSCIRLVSVQPRLKYHALIKTHTHYTTTTATTTTELQPIWLPTANTGSHQKQSSPSVKHTPTSWHFYSKIVIAKQLCTCAWSSSVHQNKLLLPDGVCY